MPMYFAIDCARLLVPSFQTILKILIRFSQVVIKSSSLSFKSSWGSQKQTKTRKLFQELNTFPTWIPGYEGIKRH